MLIEKGFHHYTKKYTHRAKRTTKCSKEELHWNFPARVYKLDRRKKKKKKTHLIRFTFPNYPQGMPGGS